MSGTGEPSDQHSGNAAANDEIFSAGCEQNHKYLNNDSQNFAASSQHFSPMNWSYTSKARN